MKTFIKRMQQGLFFLSSLAFFNSAIAQSSEQWTSIFNGQSLQGWKQLGGNAKFEVENGEIVGTSVANTLNSFIATDKEYGDFILELDIKIQH